jgi:hypothetical protein
VRPGTPLDPYLQLLDMSGNLLAEDDDGGTEKCVPSRSVQLRFTAPAADVYTVRATSYEIAVSKDIGCDTLVTSWRTRSTLGARLGCW